MELPNARIVRQAGILVAPPGVPLRRRWQKLRVKPALARVGRPFAQFFGLLLALWPLTAVVLFGILAIWSIGAHGSVRP